MVKAQIRLQWSHGLHVRRAAELVQAVKAFQARVTLSANGKSADSRSPLGLMALGAVKGTELLLQAEGPDEEAALTALLVALAKEKE